MGGERDQAWFIYLNMISGDTGYAMRQGIPVGGLQLPAEVAVQSKATHRSNEKDD